MYSYLALVPVSTILAIRFLLLLPGGLLGAFAFLFALGYGIAAFNTNWKQPVRQAQFYEDRFRVVGGQFDKELSYTDVADVSLTKKPARFLPPTRVVIKTNQNEEFVIYGNPVNKRVGADLYSWLSKRAGRP